MRPGSLGWPVLTERRDRSRCRRCDPRATPSLAPAHRRRPARRGDDEVGPALDRCRGRPHVARLARLGRRARPSSSAAPASSRCPGCPRRSGSSCAARTPAAGCSRSGPTRTSSSPARRSGTRRRAAARASRLNAVDDSLTRWAAECTVTALVPVRRPARGRRGRMPPLDTARRPGAHRGDDDVVAPVALGGPRPRTGRATLRAAPSRKSRGQRRQLRRGAARPVRTSWRRTPRR